MPVKSKPSVLLPQVLTPQLMDDIHELRILSGSFDLRYVKRATTANGEIVVGTPYRIAFPDWLVHSWTLTNQSQSVNMTFWFSSDISTTQPTYAYETLLPGGSRSETSTPYDSEAKRAAKWLFILYSTSASDIAVEFAAAGYQALGKVA